MAALGSQAKVPPVASGFDQREVASSEAHFPFQHEDGGVKVCNYLGGNEAPKRVGVIVCFLAESVRVLPLTCTLPLWCDFRSVHGALVHFWDLGR